MASATVSLYPTGGLFSLSGMGSANMRGASAMRIQTCGTLDSGGVSEITMTADAPQPQSGHCSYTSLTQNPTMENQGLCTSK